MDFINIRISSGGQSGPIDQPSHDGELSDYDYDGMTSEQKLSLILSKVSVNESRVYTIQNKLDSILNIKSRVASIENVIKSQHDRLKLLEYRSLDLEARCSRKNLVFKGSLKIDMKTASRKLGNLYARS